MRSDASFRLRPTRAFQALLLGGSVMLAGVGAVQAQKSAHKVTLRTVMQELGTEFQRLSNAILIEDFGGLEKSATAIQSHPLPDEIVAAVKSKLGRNFGGFERVDEQSHRAATDLAKRAAAKDIAGSAKAFGRLAEGCVSCHKQFRATLRSLSD